MKFLVSILLLLALSKAAFSSNSAQYEKHSLYKLSPKTAAHIDFLTKLTDANPVQLNLWSDLERGLVQPVNIMVQPGFKQEFEQKLSVQSIPFEITIENVGQTVKGQMSALKSAKLKKTLNLKAGSVNQTTEKRIVLLDQFDYSIYHDLDEIYAWMDQIGERYANMVTIVNISRSYEGRVIRGFKISVPSGKPKKAVWFDGGIHSREWVSPASVIFMTKTLLTDYGIDATVTSMLDAFDFYSVPVVNVDGFVYTFTADRFWRKTRSINPNTTCIGADPNRNWDSHFCEAGASNDPCSETYCGQSAFSEIEVRLMADFLRNIKDDLVAYLNIHSYSQLWMTPYGYTDKKPAHFKYINEGARLATQALTKVFGTPYEYGAISQIIYVASGSSADWTYDSLGVIFSYGLELRDNGTFGFALPIDQILPTAIETFEGLKALVNYIKSDPIKSSTPALKTSWLAMIAIQLFVLFSAKIF